MKKWDVLKVETILNTPWLTVEKHSCDVGGGKIIDDFYVVKRSDYVALVPVDGEDIIFVRQYRHGAADFILNLPLGFVDRKEKPENAARRELTEELGYCDGKIEYIGRFLPSPSFRSDSCYVFLADVSSARKVNVPKEPTELLESVRINKKSLSERISSGEINDASTLAALFMIKERLRI